MSAWDRKSVGKSESARRHRVEIDSSPRRIQLSSRRRAKTLLLSSRLQVAIHQQHNVGSAPAVCVHCQSAERYSSYFMSFAWLFRLLSTISFLHPRLALHHIRHTNPAFLRRQPMMLSLFSCHLWGKSEHKRLFIIFTLSLTPKHSHNEPLAAPTPPTNKLLSAQRDEKPAKTVSMLGGWVAVGRAERESKRWWWNPRAISVLKSEEPKRREKTGGKTYANSEKAVFGSFHLYRSSLFDNRKIERDGSMTRAWVARQRGVEKYHCSHCLIVLPANLPSIYKSLSFCSRPALVGLEWWGGRGN